MLPSIIDIADQHGLEVNERTRNKREVRYKCPFCREDANRPKKFYLSLNQKDNVYKCWYCKESGGVLQFEAELTGKSFYEVKRKYFGNKKKKFHPAERLSPQQLEKINWHEIKRKNYKEFKRSLEKVKNDWKRYVYNQRRNAFAKLLIGIATMKYQLVIENIKRQAEEESIPTLVEDVLNMYSSEVWNEWALEGRQYAAIALKTADSEGNKQNALTYLLISLYITPFTSESENEKKRA